MTMGRMFRARKRRKNIKYKLRKKKSLYPLFRKLYAPLPQILTCKMLYCDNITLSPTTGATATNLFSANGLYDPNVTAVGHQPRGYDQIQPLYDHYVVMGCKIRVDFQSTNTSVPMTAFVCVRDDTTTSASVNNYLELQGCKSASLGTIYGDASKTISHYCTPHKFLGRKSPMSDPQLKGSASANPTEELLYHVGVAATDFASTSSCVAQVYLEYLCKFIEPKDVAQS